MRKILLALTISLLSISILSGCKTVALNESQSIVDSLETKFETAESSIRKLEKLGVTTVDYHIMVDRLKSEFDGLKDKVHEDNLEGMAEVTSGLKNCSNKLDKVQEKITDALNSNSFNNN